MLLYIRELKVSKLLAKILTQKKASYDVMEMGHRLRHAYLDQIFQMRDFRDMSGSR